MADTINPFGALSNAEMFGGIGGTFTNISGWLQGIQSMEQLDIIGLLAIISGLVCIAVYMELLLKEISQSRMTGTYNQKYR